MADERRHTRSGRRVTSSAQIAAEPSTRVTLAADLRALGVEGGDTLLVHSSLSRLGFVVGGVVAVVQALLDVVGPIGTVVVPAFTADNSDPSRWALTRKEPVPKEWWPQIRAHLPPFDPRFTPAYRVGAIAESIRTWPRAIRSEHPQTSFAAVGSKAERVIANHQRDCHLGPHSPLGRLVDDGAKILLLGVPYGVCTAFHLAEYQVPDPPTREYECVITVNGERSWYRYRDVVLDDSDFDRLGNDLEGSGAEPAVRLGRVGAATCRLLPLPETVAFARDWMATHRSPVR
jgi:aminoglycoside 3-N-acetyltransferase